MKKTLNSAFQDPKCQKSLKDLETMDQPQIQAKYPLGVTSVGIKATPFLFKIWLFERRSDLTDYCLCFFVGIAGVLTLEDTA